MLFSQRCSGCHTLSYAATHGSAPNVRTATAISGPNFNVRCERPITRVLYAIQNGGFSGAYMPQNIVVGTGRASGGSVRGHLRRPRRAQGGGRAQVPVPADRHATAPGHHPNAVAGVSPSTTSSSTTTTTAASAAAPAAKKHKKKSARS